MSRGIPLIVVLVLVGSCAVGRQRFCGGVNRPPFQARGCPSDVLIAVEGATALAYSERGSVIVAGEVEDGGFVQSLSPAGMRGARASVSLRPRSLAVGSGGRLAVGDAFGNVSWRLSSRRPFGPSLSIEFAGIARHATPGVTALSWVGRERLWAYLDGGTTAWVSTASRAVQSSPDDAFRYVTTSMPGALLLYPWSESLPAEVRRAYDGATVATSSVPADDSRYYGALDPTRSLAAFGRSNSSIAFWSWGTNSKHAEFTSTRGRTVVAMRFLPQSGILLVAWRLTGVEAIQVQGTRTSSLGYRAYPSGLLPTDSLPSSTFRISPTGTQFALLLHRSDTESDVVLLGPLPFWERAQESSDG